MTMNIERLHDEGVRILREEHEKQEVEKLGILRAGNSGIILPEGGVAAGKCPRQTYLRYKGVEFDPVSPDRELMFAAGVSNEDIWAEILSKSFAGKILREEEIGISWDVDADGLRTKVTGRPDIVLADETGKPIRGIELKLVSSVWTARDILNNEPKMMHLIQAAHYMWRLEVPFELWYTSRADFPIIGWMITKKLFPSYGEAGSEFMEWTYYEIDRGSKRKVDEVEWSRIPDSHRVAEAKKLLPFKRGFELQWGAEGQIQFRRVNSQDKWFDTVITAERITQYYQSILSMEAKNTLGPIPKNVGPDGRSTSWKFCDYCPLKHVCISEFAETVSTQRWLRDVQLYLNASRR